VQPDPRDTAGLKARLRPSADLNVRSASNRRVRLRDERIPPPHAPGANGAQSRGLLLAFYMAREMLLLMAYMAGGQSAAEAWKEIP